MEQELLEKGEKEAAAHAPEPSRLQRWLADARERVGVVDAAKLRRWGVLCALICGWYFFSITFNTNLKKVLKAAPCPYLAGLACFAVSTALSLAAWATQLYPLPSLPPGRLQDVLSSALPHVAVRAVPCFAALLLLLTAPPGRTAHQLLPGRPERRLLPHGEGAGASVRRRPVLGDSGQEADPLALGGALRHRGGRGADLVHGDALWEA